MSYRIGSGFISTHISNQKITDILNSKLPPEMTVFEKIKEFFFFSNYAEILECLYLICHPPHGTMPEDVEKLFQTVKDLAYPGYADNILICNENDYQADFSIIDKKGREILNACYKQHPHYTYTVTTGTSKNYSPGRTSRRYPLHPQQPELKGVINNR